mgnify:CR=1 FL=1
MTKQKKLTLNNKKRDILLSFSRDTVKASPPASKKLEKLISKITPLHLELCAFLNAETEKVYPAADMDVLAKYNPVDAPTIRGINCTKTDAQEFYFDMLYLPYVAEQHSLEGTNGNEDIMTPAGMLKTSDLHYDEQVTYYMKMNYDPAKLHLNAGIPYTPEHTRRGLTFNVMSIGDRNEFLRHTSLRSDIDLVIHEPLKERRLLLNAYSDLIWSSKTLEDVVAVWPEANDVRHKLSLTSTAISLMSESNIDLIKRDIKSRAKRNRNDEGVTESEAKVSA